MSEEIRRGSAYLEALARLQPGWAHESRGNLGAIKIQIDLLSHLLAIETGDPVKVDELRLVVDRAVNAIRKFEASLKLQFEAWGPSEPGDMLDLARLVTNLGALLGASARDLRVPCSVESPSGPIWIEGGEPALREALTIAAVEMLCIAKPRDPLMLRLEARGERASLRIESPRMPPEDASWLAVVRETLARFGGEVRTSAALELDLVVPRAAVPR